MGKGAATLSENGDFVAVLDSEKLDRERVCEERRKNRAVKTRAKTTRNRSANYKK